MARSYKKKSRKKGGWLGKWIRRSILAVVFFGLGAVAGLAAVFYYFSSTLPPIGPLLEGYDPPQTTRIVASDGTVLGELFEERRTVVSIDHIPQVMIDAVIATEDADFRDHTGLDYPGMVRAMLTNFRTGRLAQGASTITQQVARTFFLTREKTFARKVREILLTKRIEELLTKDEILFLYLNQINFGHARYGVQEAAKYYFGKDIEDITLAEAATLAAIPKGPSIYSPRSHPKASKMRRQWVLGEMQRRGYVNKKAAQKAKDANLKIVPSTSANSSLAPEALALAIEQIKDVVSMNDLRHGGYLIETTLDPKLQRAARQSVVDGLQQIDQRHGRLAPYKVRKRWPKGDRGKGSLREGRTYVGKVTGYDKKKNKIEVTVGKHSGWININAQPRYNPEKLGPRQFAAKGAKLHVSLAGPPVEGPLDFQLEQGPQSALVVINPADGSIVAMIGGDSVKSGGFDRATSARRQPGSAFKPFVYLAALRSGRYTTATIVDDAPEVHGEWQPKNSHDDYAGEIRLRQALARSLNLPAVKLITDIGPEKVATLAEQMGIASKLEPTPALGLGSSAVTPVELAASYTTMASGGTRYKPWIVKRVLGPGNLEIPLFGRSQKQVITQAQAFVITSMLRSVVEEGTGTKARKLGRYAVGKTGTSNDQRDAWFAGYTTDFVCVVWVGYDDMRSIGRKEYGGRAALPIWIDFMKKAHDGKPKNKFEIPEGITTAVIDPASGLLAYEGMENTMTEIFIEGSQPTETLVPPELDDPENFLLDQMEEDTEADTDTEAFLDP